ncbi:alternative ribosome rescue aminoacyl-tRNA hydrolase ArfB [Streptomyces lydicus]|nr:alternative ribosome rescue aminoacyl-tRNA hydrolase ArfB [Streptomyces lydicus]
MSGPHVIRGAVVLPEAELVWRFSRSSGPGGQHVNTSDSQVELRFDLGRTQALPPVWKERALERLAGRLTDGVLSVRASEHRSQWRNRETAAVRLAALLAEATAPRPSRAASRGSHGASTSGGCGEEAARRHQARPLGPRLGLTGPQAPSPAVPAWPRASPRPPPRPPLTPTAGTSPGSTSAARRPRRAASWPGPAR